jgi:L-alanine-DL-glutamate epimerase-like enolase superfamily enzyme
MAPSSYLQARRCGIPASRASYDAGGGRGQVSWNREELFWGLSCPAFFSPRHRLTTSGGIRHVQFDATRAAGFTEALRIAQLAEQHGVMVAPHTAPELHGHLVLALPRCAFGVEGHGGATEDPLGCGLFLDHPELHDGHLHLNDKPGFGLEVDWAFVDKYQAGT